MKKKNKKKIITIAQSVPFYTISIFFAHFIHIHMMTNPNIFHAMCALLVSFSISFCFIYGMEFIIDWMQNFQEKLLEESKSSKEFVEHQQRIIENQRIQIEEIDARIEEKLRNIKERTLPIL